VTKKAKADAKKDYARHIEEGRPIRYPWLDAKPWPVHRWTEIESEEEYGVKGGLAYQVKWRELYWAEVKELIE
jgi:hypothetical protein